MVEDALDFILQGKAAGPQARGLGGFTVSGYQGSGCAVLPAPAQPADEWASVPIYAETSTQS